MSRVLADKRIAIPSLLAFFVCRFSAGSSLGIYELRTYTTNDGKLENLYSRFRDHTRLMYGLLP